MHYSPASNRRYGLSLHEDNHTYWTVIECIMCLRARGFPAIVTWFPRIRAQEVGLVSHFFIVGIGEGWKEHNEDRVHGGDYSVGI